jgi:preprotein translocase subunit SecG
MRRFAVALVLSLVTLALLAPVALAARLDNGEGLYGETNDKVVTNAGFILIGAFPLVVLLLSLLQWRLDKRKDAKKKAVKAAGGDSRWRGGW